MEEVFYFLVAAAGVSFLWLLLTGYRQDGESKLAGAVHLCIVVITSGLVFAAWRRLPGLTFGLSLAYGALSALLWVLLPSWNTRAHTFLVAFAAAQLAFLGRIAWAIFFRDLAPPVVVGSLILFTAEFVVVVLTLYFAYEVLNVISRIRWRRNYPPFTGSNDYWPKVSIHVPAHAEPPEMVIETLTALRNLDYPTYEVIMVDDNTQEDELWRPVMEYCHRAGIKVFHLQNYPGFKSGALNFALVQTAPDAEIISVVDSDYIVEPNFLRETVPYFHDPRVAFVQTPQSFRNSDENLFARYSALAQRFFFEISMRSRNEHNAIIFCGTMGLIRKRVLERIGGWDEWCITEDAEASLRILRKSYQSIYINQSYGHGLLPTTFEDTKKQRFRWAFGGIQILRRYWRALISLPWDISREGLTLPQRLAYLMGLLGWVNDLLVLLFTVFLLLTVAAFTQGWELPVRELAEWILLVPLLSIITGMLRVAWALRLSTGCSWRDGMGAFAAMLSMSWTVAHACLAALCHSRGKFLRTPKFTSASNLTRALRAAVWEMVLGIILVAAIPLVLNVRTNRESLLLSALLGWHALVYLSASWSALLENKGVRPSRAPSHSQDWGIEGVGGRVRASISPVSHPLPKGEDLDWGVDEGIKLPDWVFKVGRKLRLERLSLSIPQQILIALIILGTALRIYLLGDKSIWLDEAFSVTLSQRNFVDVLRMTIRTDTHPPLYYLTLNLWLALGGSEGWVRLLSAIFSLSSIFLMYKLCNELFQDAWAGLVGAAILAFSPFQIWYAQEARMYAMLSFFVLASAWFFIRSLRTGAPKDWAGYIVATTLGLYTDSGAIWYLLAIGGFYLISFKRFPGRIRGFLASQMAVGLLYAPWLPFFWKQTQQLTEVVGWLPPPTVQTVLGTFLDFNSFNLPWIEVSLLYMTVIFVWVFIDPERSWQQRLATLWLIVPLVTSLLLSLRQPIFLSRNLIAASLGYYLLITSTIWKFRSTRATLSLLLPLLAMNLVSTGYNAWKVEKENWRAAAAYVAEMADRMEGGLLVFVPRYIELPFHYYFEQYNLPIDTQGYPGDEVLLHPQPDQVEDLANLFRDRPYVWLVLRDVEAVDPDWKVKTWLDQNGYARYEDFVQGDISLLTYVRWDRAQNLSFPKINSTKYATYFPTVFQGAIAAQGEAVVQEKVVGKATATPVHIVRFGETLSEIALNYGTTVHALVEVNGIQDPRRLKAGEELVIP